MLKEVKVQTGAMLSARSCSHIIIWMKSNNIDLTCENFMRERFVNAAWPTFTDHGSQIWF